MIFVLAGPFPQLIPACIVGILREQPLEFFDKRLIQRPPLVERRQIQFVCCFCIADLKQSPQIAGIGCNTVPFKNFACIVIGDALVFYFSRMIRKRNAMTVQGLGKFRIRRNFSALPQGDRLVVLVHQYSSNSQSNISSAFYIRLSAPFFPAVSHIPFHIARQIIPAIFSAADVRFQAFNPFRDSFSNCSRPLGIYKIRSGKYFPQCHPARPAWIHPATGNPAPAAAVPRACS